MRAAASGAWKTASAACRLVRRSGIGGCSRPSVPHAACVAPVPAFSLETYLSYRGFARLASDESRRHLPAEQLKADGPLGFLLQKLEAQPEECVQVIEDWRAEGNVLNADSVAVIYDRLLGLSQQNAAWKVMKHVRENFIVQLTPENCIREIVLPRASLAEKAYCALPAALKTDEVTTAFVLSLIRQNAYAKAMKWEKQVERPTAELLNAMILVYFSRDKHDEVLQAYEEMKQLKLAPMLTSYLVLLKCKKRIGGLEELEAETRSVLEQLDLETADEQVLYQVLQAYAYLDDKAGVEKTWNLLMRDPQVDSYSYGVEAFGLVGNVEKAEAIFKEAVEGNKVTADGDVFLKMIEMYSRQGLMEAAEYLVEQIPSKDFRPFDSIVRGYLAKDEVDKALATLKKGYRKEHVLPSYETVMSLLPVFASRKDIEGAERLCYSFQGHGDTACLNELLKVYAAVKKQPPLSLVCKLGCRANEETVQLMKKTIHDWKKALKNFATSSERRELAAVLQF